MAIENDIIISHGNDQLRMELPSTMEAIDRADQESRIFLKKQGLDSEIFPVCLCLREGLTNAVRHGNQNSSSKTVRYVLRRDDAQLIMMIEDDGEGFDWKVMENSRPDFESDHGRGLMIMRNYFSIVKFNEQGNKLTLVKNLFGEKDVSGQDGD